MGRLTYILLHALAAAAFGFVLQRFVLAQTMETGAVWAIVFGLAAAGLARHQSNR